MDKLGIINKKILKEIEKAYKSNSYEFLYDLDGQYGEKEACYLKFKTTNNIYDEQTHILRIKFKHGANNTRCYPIESPNVIFMTPILHANVAESGSICLDILQDKWSSLYGVENIFNSILILLEEPNLNSPFSAYASQIHNQFKNNTKEYKIVSNNYYNSKIQKNIKDLVEMKFMK